MRIVWSIVALIAAAAPALPQTVGTIQKVGGFWTQTIEGELQAGSDVRVNSSGKIRITGDTGSRQVRYKVVKRVKARNPEEARQWLEQSRFTAARQGIIAVIDLTDPQCRRCAFGAEMQINVPRETRRSVLDTRGGSLEATGLAGSLMAKTAGGSITVNDVGGDVEAATAGGSIDIGQIGGRVRSETAGGSIRLGSTGGPADLRTSGGSIEARQVRGDLRAETAGGNITAEKVEGNIIAATSGGSIHIGEVSGSVDAETAGGSISVNSAPLGVRAETAGGGIELNNVAGRVIATSAAGPIRAYFVAGRPMGDSLLETTAGNIVVLLPVGIALRVDAMIDFASGTNHIRTDFDSIRVQRSEQGFGPGRVIAAGELNGGGPVLRIRNTNGRIEIQKRQ